MSLGFLTLKFDRRERRIGTNEQRARIILWRQDINNFFNKFVLRQPNVFVLVKVIRSK